MAATVVVRTGSVDGTSGESSHTGLLCLTNKTCLVLTPTMVTADRYSDMDNWKEIGSKNGQTRDQ